MMQGGAQFGGGSQQQSYGQRGGSAGWQQAQRGPTLEDACNVLGVKPTDDAATVKRAYRKLMSEHHPDKLVAKGLPPEMMEMAAEAQEIQKAWELIKEQRGLNDRPLRAERCHDAPAARRYIRRGWPILPYSISTSRKPISRSAPDSDGPWFCLSQPRSPRHQPKSSALLRR